MAGGALKRAIRFATYDWTRELPMSLRVITMIGMGIQGYAIWAALSRSLIWPIMWPSGVILYATILLIYYIGFCSHRVAGEANGGIMRLRSACMRLSIL